MVYGDEIIKLFLYIIATIILTVIFVVPLIIVIIEKISNVIKKIHYYKMEINRSLSVRERSFWKRRLKRYYLSLIPIVNLFAKKKAKRKVK